MIKNAEFERCMDFLARMIEKYGNDVILPDMENTLRTGTSFPDGEAAVPHTIKPDGTQKIA